MKRWPVIIISLIIALGVVAYGISLFMNVITFTDEPAPSGGIPLPSIEVQKTSPSAKPTVSSSPAALHTESPTAVPASTAKPSSTPSPSTEPTPFKVSEEILPSMTPAVSSPPSSPEELLSAVNNSSFKETKDESTYSSAPVISIDGGTIPEVISLNNVVDIRGKVTCSPGVLEFVKAEIIDGEKVAQSCSFAPFSDVLSLAGTVNADLHFARLAVGDYTYRITATAKNGDAVSNFVLIDEPFSVVAPGSAELAALNPGDTAGGYIAKQSDGTSTSDLIWNFLIDQFDNPYAAAGIMANMEAESSLNPTASQGDTPECGYGLCQWTQTRKQNLKDFAYIVSTDVSDLDLQLCFLMYELENDYPKLKEFLMNVSDGYLAASEFYAIYEQAASPGNRCTFAKKYLDKYALPD